MSLKTALGAALLAAALAAPAAPAAANVQVGASGWQWGNPLPQGNTLRAASFAGGSGYAAGDFGTLLKTTDGGTSWSGLPVGTLQGLSVVQAVDGDTVVAGGGCVARRSTDGGRSFTSVAFASVESSCRAELRDLSFVTRDAGFLLLRDGSVLATTDGGTQFAPRTAVPETPKAGGSSDPGALAFLTADKGFATSGGRIFRTLNGGSSWRAIEPSGPALNRLWFSDAQHGFAVGQAGRFLRTDDGGETWAAKSVAPGGQALTSISCNSSRFCVLATATGKELIRTADAGDGASGVITPSTDPVYAAAFASPARIAGVGANGATVVSDDAGDTFGSVGGRLGGTYLSLRAGGEPGSAFALGASGALAKTTDGGRSWVSSDVTTSADLVDVSFPTAGLGYALDGDRGLFRTTNGGAVWQTLGTGSTRQGQAVLAPDEQVVLVVGPRGVRRSTDQGETFEQVRAPAVLRAQLFAAAPARGAIFAWGPTAVARSLDRGRTWTSVPKPGRSARERRALRIAQVAFSSASSGLLRELSGRVWRTTNAGRSWTLLSAIGTAQVTGIVSSSARSAYVVVDSFGGRTAGFVLRTGDGGATWAPQFVTDPLIRTVVPGGGVDYLLTSDNGLLFSTTGGVAGAPSELTLATRRRRLTKPQRITVTGRLRPAGAAARVTVSALRPGQTTWSPQTVAVASNGTFATAWRVPAGTTTFVAQWAGDVASAGAGSRTMTVTVAPPRRR